MATATTLTELRKMSSTDLQKEIATLQLEVKKMRMHTRLGKQKDTAKYVRARKQLARMKTVQTELQSVNEKATISAPSSSKEEASSYTQDGIHLLQRLP